MVSASDIETLAAADGSVGVDHAWKVILKRQLDATPLTTSLEEALQPLFHLLGADDANILMEVIEGKREEWSTVLYEPQFFGLPPSYRLDFAVAIYVYTLENPGVYRVINREMFNHERLLPGAAGGISDGLRVCMPYIKFLDSALEALPDAYVYRGQVCRGVKFVYPSPAQHNPQSYFHINAHVMWYEFKSTSYNLEVMTRPGFCGVAAGPRTIFKVDAVRAYLIEKFSHFQGLKSECEVLFRPLSLFQVCEKE